MPIFSHVIVFPGHSLPGPWLRFPSMPQSDLSPGLQACLFSGLLKTPQTPHAFLQNPPVFYHFMDDTILPVVEVRNIGITPDAFSHPTFHIQSFQKFCYFSFKNISQICLLQTMSTDRTPDYLLPRLWQQPHNWPFGHQL